MDYPADSTADERDQADISVRQLLLETLCSAQLESDCGLRPAQLAVLTPGDFDLLHGTVQVSAHSGTELRTMPERLRRELEAYLSFFPSQQEPLFADLDGHFQALIQTYVICDIEGGYPNG